MNISNLKKGQIIKNYKELCSILEVPVKKANSKESQLKELSTYVKYSKVGHSFTIIDVYEEPLIKIDGRRKNNAVYITHTENLILDMLNNSLNDCVGYLCKSGFLEKTNIVNDNFKGGRYEHKQLSRELSLPTDMVSEFYRNYNRFFISLIENAISSLERDKIIRVERRTMIILPNDGFIIATEKEHKKILEFEYKIKNELMATGKYDNSSINLVLSNLSRRRCLKELGYKNYFEVYKIFYSKNIIKNELSRQDRIECSNKLLGLIGAKVDSTVSNNWSKYIKRNQPHFGIRNDLYPESLYIEYMNDILYNVTNIGKTEELINE